MRSRNSTDVGVRELHRFEYASAGIDHERVLLRSWLSMRATLRPAVAADAPVQIVSDYHVESKMFLTKRGQNTEACWPPTNADYIVDLWRGRCGIASDLTPNLLCAASAYIGTEALRYAFCP